MDRLEPVYTSLAYIVTFMGVSFILFVVRNCFSSLVLFLFALDHSLMLRL